MLERLFGLRRIARITSEELKRRSNLGEGPFLVDVREPWEYRLGHIAGARAFPFEDLTRRLDEIPRDRPIVCICRDGNLAEKAAKSLARSGFAEVANLSGGMLDWVRSGYPVSH